jgi:hypothetical protein
MIFSTDKQISSMLFFVVKSLALIFCFILVNSLFKESTETVKLLEQRTDSGMVINPWEILSFRLVN